MPNIYLSPSTQEFNEYVNGGTEEYYMNLIADAMEPYLNSSGITYTRNTPYMTAASSIVQSNMGDYDLHLALHSNAAPVGQSGNYQGTDVYYYPTSVKGREAATIIANNLKEIYPYPELVKAISTTTIGEVRKTRAPSVLIEFAYHDNVEDANWIKQNINEIARNVVISLTDFFGIPFVEAQIPQTGVVSVRFGYLNIRSEPNTYSPILTIAYNGEYLTVLGTTGNWYVVNYNGTVGYANSAYIDIVG